MIGLRVQHHHAVLHHSCNVGQIVDKYPSDENLSTIYPHYPALENLSTIYPHKTFVHNLSTFVIFLTICPQFIHICNFRTVEYQIVAFVHHLSTIAFIHTGKYEIRSFIHYLSTYLISYRPNAYVAIIYPLFIHT